MKLPDLPKVTTCHKRSVLTEYVGPSLSSAQRSTHDMLSRPPPPGADGTPEHTRTRSVGLSWACGLLKRLDLNKRPLPLQTLSGCSWAKLRYKRVAKGVAAQELHKASGGRVTVLTVVPGSHMHMQGILPEFLQKVSPRMSSTQSKMIHETMRSLVSLPA